jgi:hypothetical protein
VATLAAAGVLASAAAAVAQAPAAVVEDVSGDLRGVAFMDYVAPGQVIELGPGNALVLGYLRSCWRETIHGGTVTVGAEQSDVQAGQVERVKVDCDGGKMLLSSDQASKSGVFAIRGAEAPPPQFVIYSASPVIELSRPGEVLIERLDKGGADIKVDEKELLKGRFYDLARMKKELVPGGTYRAASGESTVIFKVDANAKPGQSPLIGRLVRL